METVYTTKAGHRFHASDNCRALNSGQVLYGGWGDLRVHHIEETSIVEAMGRGREACATCFPGLRAAWYRGNSEDDYGHQPVEVGGINGRARVCARCRQADVYGYAREDYVRWPCTSAIVLGLVPREVTP